MPRTQPASSCLQCSWLQVSNRPDAGTDTPLSRSTEISCPVVAYPLTTFVHLTREKLAICDLLEETADQLPEAFNKSDCAVVASQLPGLLALCDDICETIAFPLLLRHRSVSNITPAMVKRIAGERSMDQGYAWEVCELLNGLADGVPAGNAEAGGYLLRAFFETVRRSSAFDLEYTIPLARRYISDEERMKLSAMLRLHRGVLASHCNAMKLTVKSRKLH